METAVHELSSAEQKRAAGRQKTYHYLVRALAYWKRKMDSPRAARDIAVATMSRGRYEACRREMARLEPLLA